MATLPSSEPNDHHYACVAEAIRALEGLGAQAPGDESAAPAPATVLRAAAAVLKAYAQKNPAYGDSWCRRGEPGIFHNIARKFDRLEFILRSDGEVRYDDALDLATYAVLHLAWHLRSGQA